MLEIRFVRTSKSKELFIDGELVDAYVFKSRKHSSIYLHDYEDSARVASHLFADLPSELGSLELRCEIEWAAIVDVVNIKRFDNDSFEIGFKFEFSFDKWKEPYSFREYATTFSQAIRDFMASDVTYDADDEVLANGFWVKFIVQSPKSSIATNILMLSDALRRLNKRVVETLESQAAAGSVIVSFEFPEEVRVTCEQYLLYFVQFLKDLGVDATADLRHEAEQILFAVTPSDKNTALENIRIALQTYLELASSPIDNSSIIETEIAVQRLAANVDHLKGQLRLAHAENLLKAATIQTQQITINSLLSGDVILQSIKKVTPKDRTDEPEQLLGGTVALTRIDKYGIQVNLAEIFRKLRRRFFPE